jgi:hypothetical protein
MPPLKDYRLYTLDEQGHIAKAEVLSLASEEEALAAGRERAQQGRPVEVWHRSERITSIVAKHEALEDIASQAAPGESDHARH